MIPKCVGIYFSVRSSIAQIKEIRRPINRGASTASLPVVRKNRLSIKENNKDIISIYFFMEIFFLSN